MPRVTELLVNGSQRRIDADPDRTLLSVLRDDLDLTGTKFGCGEGQCAACTVLIDGVAAKSCLMKVGAVGAKSVVTIEGLASDGGLHPMQQAFLDADALQCGYCTPGMIMTAVALLRAKPQAGRDEIRDALDRNICRCGTHLRILSAVERAAKGGPER